MPGGSPKSPALAGFLPAFPALLRKQTKGAVYPAARAILSAAVEGASTDFDTASRIESRYLTNLIINQGSKNMIQAFFFDLQAINSGSLRPQGIEPWKATKVGVLGAGMMGAGIAYSCARAGMEVVLKDVAQDAADKGKAYSEGLLDKAISRGKSTEEKKAELLGRITATTDPADLAGCDLVIEAVFEDPSLKHKVFAEIAPHVNPDALLCSNTSTLPITELAEGVDRPKDFIGLHFFSPVDKMPLVEIIRGKETSDVRAGQGLRRRAADQEDPDRGQRQPRLLHLAGDRHDGLRGSGDARRGRPPGLPGAGGDPGRLPRRHAAALRRAQHGADAQDLQGDRGRGRSRRGRLTPSTPASPWPRRWSSSAVPRGSRAPASTTTSTASARASGPAWPRQFPVAEQQIPLQDIKDRMLFAEALETAKCFEENVITSAAAANIGSIMGIGFPPMTGGAAQFMTGYEGADGQIGLAAFVKRADELAAAYGATFEATAYLRDLASSGGSFPA